MTRNTKGLLTIIIILVITNVFSLFGYLPSQKQTSEKASVSPSPHISVTPPAAVLPVNTTEVTVISVTDGDTFKISTGQTVRMIGIDTPETVDPRKAVQCFGKDASAHTKEILLGKIVRLEKDISETDRYGRLLRYVYVGDEFINQSLIREGFARSSSYPPDIKYQQLLQIAEEEAREAQRGLWSTCLLSPTPGVQSSIKDSTTNEDKDCKDFSTQAEAQAYFNNKGGSLTNNVDRLDGSDSDGRVCETLPNLN